MRLTLVAPKQQLQQFCGPTVSGQYLNRLCGLMLQSVSPGEASNQGKARIEEQGKSAPSICVFDVNETLLDIECIGPLFRRLFGERKVLREWFGQLVLYSNVITLSLSYVPFFEPSQGVLKMLGDIYHIAIKDSDAEELRTRMLTMPARPDVPPGLKLLQDAGFRLVTLTNSPPVPGTIPAPECRTWRLV